MPSKARMKFSPAFMAIKIISDQTPHGLFEKLMRNAYQEAGKPKQIYMFTLLHKKHGNEGFHNWINSTSDKIPLDWHIPPYVK